MSRERTAYFEELSALLRERDMPPARVDALVRELAAYAVEARSPLVEEFGPAGELADRLTDRQSADAADGPEAGAETWVWTADALQEVRLLERFGGQGWEVERLDRLGRFVCRRDRQHPLRWAYRREAAGPRERERLTGRLATEGWEPCGVWGPFAYFKRPEAAVTGPAARLSRPPAPPRRRVYFAPRLCVTLVASVLVAVVMVRLGASGTGSTDGETLAGALVGLAAGGLLGARVWKSASRKHSG
ncbi:MULTISPECIES: hypothetical protein [Streptomyces]|uniref:DUF2812 domain-containing protein n=3 Tax=Streptomyces TaxID=1883 RepID=A0A380PC70_STRGR|nr:MULTISPECIES: hypothetical protein [Streptomyces]NEE45167.1 hypothetical protein [Streptomyces sp. SID8455]WSU37840.1 hypothetical protein OG378_19640 [Streptomyces gougerotii]MDQ0295534.1 hypothetical protein [Streptomyces sp. DSM 41037]NEC13572.1 hypothetical protein [Streptomyces sp. SID8014]PJM84969.1 hypothetical protein CH313_03070 [Streptomyces sp. TSRI0384-2]